MRVEITLSGKNAVSLNSLKIIAGMAGLDRALNVPPRNCTDAIDRNMRIHFREHFGGCFGPLMVLISGKSGTTEWALCRAVAGIQMISPFLWTT
jgi:hypothetical protein